jgi:hypothetical protein
VTYTFAGPVLENKDRIQQDLWWAKADIGVTVIRVGGVWSTVMSATQTVLDTADRVYRGGYTYTLTDALAAELIAAGFENYLQIATTGPELITNPGFDGSPDLNGWVGFFSSINLDTSVVQQGRASMRLDLPAGQVYVAEMDNVIPVTASATYALSGWVKTAVPLVASAGTEGIDLWPIFGATSSDCQYFEGGAVIDTTINNLSTTTTWAQHSAKIVVPPTCNFMRLTPRAYTAGSGNSVYWDNMSFRLAAA